MEIAYLLIPIIALAAFLLKATTGFGPAIVVVALGSLLAAPKEIIVTSSILDAIAGFFLLYLDRPRDAFRFWLSLSAAIVVGSVFGGPLIVFIPAEYFRYLFSVVILLLGVWFVLRRGRVVGKGLQEHLPRKSSIRDLLITFFGGLCGGLFGISGPPIIWHFGRKFAKNAFRRTLVPIFCAAAVARVVTYSTSGLVSERSLLLALAALPGLVLGLYWGNKIFFRISEQTFSRVAGMALITVALYLLL